MSELDVERALADEWLALVAAARPDAAPPPTPPDPRGGPLRRRAIWAELEDVRLTMAELHAALDDDPDRAGLRATTHWSVGDVAAHLASWAAEFRRQIETIARRDTFDYLITFTPRVGPTAWNERALASRRGRSVDAAFAEFERETSRLQDLALELPDETLFGVADLPMTPDGTAAGRWRQRVAEVMLVKCFHDRYHIDRLRDLVQLPE